MALNSEIVVLRDETGLLLPEYRTLTTKKANCAGFLITDGDHRGVPLVTIHRRMTDSQRKKDHWNDDGRPATVLFRILCPTIMLFDGTIEIIGFEESNLCCAGLMVEPYKNKERPYADRLDKERRNSVSVLDDKRLFPQRVVLR